MNKHVTIVDYGASNLLNVQHALEHVGARVSIATTPEQILAADRVVFPGVGAFPDAMAQLTQKELLEPLKEAASKKPFLGICLGMQMLFEHSDEFERIAGLGLINGSIVPLPNVNQQGTPLTVPHIGWRPLNFTQPTSPLASHISFTDDTFYFVHSFHAMTASNNLVSTTTFGDIEIAAIVAKDNIYGCQFHPEKSGQCGLTMLTNFLKI
ncbi:imidazole glycerol phosphate synthase subunit HisH [Thalassotalea fusca]